MTDQNLQIGRNEPCPCGSGKKYERCCGQSAAPKLSEPAASSLDASAAGIDPSQLDPEMMVQLASAFQRMPKGQMQRLQYLIQQTMSGKDVSREMEQFQENLPVEFQSIFATIPTEKNTDVPTDLVEATTEQSEGSKISRWWNKIKK